MSELSIKNLTSSICQYTYFMKVLNFTNIGVSDKTIPEILNLIHELQGLRSLKLSKNSIKGPGAIQLLKTIGVSASLKYLDLSCNNIGYSIENKGDLAQAFELAIKYEVLRHLDISYNQI